MTDLQKLLTQISTAAGLIPLHEDTLAIDTALGDLSALIYEARDEISAQWKQNREKPITAIDLEELGL